jgi:hypothetical protein
MTAQRSEVIYSKHDWWATLMVWGIAAVCWVMGLKIFLTAALQGGQLLGGVGSLIAGMGAPWFWLTTRYKLSELSLTLMSGPFFKSIDYEDIQGVSDGRKKKGLSFAFSMDCLQIDVAGSSLGYRISPKNQHLFLSAMAKRCDHLTLQGQELIPKQITR